ncbi:hypothetical protein BP5796_13198 [Coleophoma crateriformis]|uniref:Octanoyltransferase n=1 Tax=Coleophoma crateriformis TaxID=565419 RepID=A0A3D8Q3K1_9HELO|nr:hypothetical protein BP5796_13198 [Coleophoma crateriformis]
MVRLRPNLLHYSTLYRFHKYAAVNDWQQRVVEQFLAHKAAVSKAQHSGSSALPSEAPTPTILTFSPQPAYATGRREIDSLTPQQVEEMKTPMPAPAKWDASNVADILPTLRGGQITFHGPGQLVIYPILDLRAVKSGLWPKGLGVRDYVNLLEETTIRTVGRFGINATRTENPGVWLTEGAKGERKIAALGVHLRRNVTSFGVGLNVATDLRWFDRIVGCGLVGKGTTSLENELPEKDNPRDQIQQISKWWVEEFVRGVWGPEGSYESWRLGDLSQSDNEPSNWHAPGQVLGRL